MYRYWDGHAWSAVTSANPSAPPPSQGIGQPGSEQESEQGQSGEYGQQGQYGSGQQSAYQAYQQQPKKKSAAGWWIGGVAVLVVVVLVAVFAIRGISGAIGPNDPGSGGGGTQDQCPTTTDLPTANPNHPNDGRVHGGPLSYPMLGAPWEPPTTDTRVPFGSDVQVQQITIERNYEPRHNWVASILIAELLAGDGFYTPEQGSEIVAKCVVGEFYGDNPVQREDKESKAMKVDGHEAWYLESHLTFDIEGLEAKGETMIIVIVSAGASSGLYYASIPDNATQYIADAEKSLKALTVEE